jgi:hypothetical protein
MFNGSFSAWTSLSFFFFSLRSRVREILYLLLCKTTSSYQIKEARAMSASESNRFAPSVTPCRALPGNI